jgi:glycosyltransferase involved in cell wall biosynthesis
LRVLQVLVGAGARTGGPPAFVGGAAVALGKLGVDVRVVATDTALAPWSPLQRQRRIRPDEIHPALARCDLRLFPARFPRRMAYSPGLAAELDGTVRDFDVVHIHNLWQFPQYAGFRAASRHGVPYIVSPHGSLDPYLRRRGRVRKAVSTRLWQGRMLGKAKALHVTTDAEKELIRDLAPSVPRSIVPCGLHVDEFSTLPDPGDFRRRRLGGYDGPIVLFLGRITDKKGVDVLIRAFATVRRAGEARLVIAGPDDSGLVPKLTRLVGQLSLQADDVEFTGPIFGEERLAALAAADVWALSSHTENFGIAVVEAAAAGCPVVISPGVNLAQDLLVDHAGVVAEATPEVFGAALRSLLEDDAERSRLRRAGPEWAARYDWSRVAPRLAAMYRGAVEGVEPRVTE